MCDNQVCQDVRKVIRQKLSEGQTPDQVVQYLVGRYGEGILLTPPQQGLNLAAWYLPIAALGLGALLVFTFVRHSLQRQKRIEHQRGPPDPVLERYRERVRRDLEQMDGPRARWF